MDKIKIRQEYNIPDSKGNIYTEEVIWNLHSSLVENKEVMKFEEFEGEWMAIKVSSDDKAVYLEMERISNEK